MRAASWLLFLLLPVSAYAEIVDIKWSGGAFSHKASLAPKSFLEVCGKLKKGAEVVWNFKGNATSDFNIHYHVGREVSYPEQRKGVVDGNGNLSVALDQDYCWMWSNPVSQMIEIEVTLKQAKQGN